MIQSAEFAILSLLQIFTNVIIIIFIIIENKTKMKINQRERNHCVTKQLLVR